MTYDKTRPPHVWAKPFRRRCRARLSRDTAETYWGRCDLAPHARSVDHALERGMIVVRWEWVAGIYYENPR